MDTITRFYRSLLPILAIIILISANQAYAGVQLIGGSVRDGNFQSSAASGGFPSSGYWTRFTSGGMSGAACVANTVANYDHIYQWINNQNVDVAHGLWNFTGTSAGYLEYWSAPYNEVAASSGPNIHYDLSVMIRQPNANPYPPNDHSWAPQSGAYAQIEFLDSNYASLLTVNGTPSITGDNQSWVQCQAANVTAPAGTAHARVYLRVQKPQDSNIKSIACFDEVVLTKYVIPAAAINSITPNPAKSGTAVNFSGTGSTPEGTITEYNWTYGSGIFLSNQASFSKSDMPAGTHTVKFKVKNSFNDWSPEVTQSITINVNQVPTAKINYINPANTGAGRPVMFSGTGTDTDGSITEYSWRSSLEGPIGSQAYFSRASAVLGTHTVFLKVKDDSGAWSPEVQITYNVRQAPTASIASITPETIYEGDHAIITASAQAYNGAAIVEYRYSGSREYYPTYPGQYMFTGGTTAGNPYDQWCLFTGTRTLYLKAKDSNGIWSDEMPFNITSINRTPEAYIDSLTPNPGIAGEEVTMVAHIYDGQTPYGTIRNCIAAVDGRIVYQGGNPNVNCKITGLSLGTHNVTFQGWDYQGLSSNAARATLMVNSRPQAKITSPIPVTINEGDRVTLTGEATDYGGSIVQYQWLKLEGVYNQQWTVVSNFTGYSIMMDYPVTVKLRFQAKDNDGAWSNPVDLSLTWQNKAPMASIDSISPIPAQQGQAVAFSGHGSETNIPFNTIVSCKWESSIDGVIYDYTSAPMAGPGASSAAPGAVIVWRPATFSPNFSKSDLSVGTHTITLKVKDCYGAWSEASQAALTITNTAPAAAVESMTPSQAYEGDKVVLKGGGTDAGNGTLVEWRWSQYQNYDPNAYLSNQREYTIPCYFVGSRTVYLKVKDNNGAWSPEIPVTVTAANRIPTAYIDSITPPVALAGEQVVVTGHISDGNLPYGTIRTTMITLDGRPIWGSSNGSPNVSFTLPNPGLGTHTITFAGNDYCGAWSPQVVKNFKIVNPPVVRISSPADKSRLANNTALITASVSSDEEIAKVELYIGGELARTYEAAPYEYNWDISRNKYGIYKVKAVATTAAGHTASAQIMLSKGVDFLQSPAAAKLEQTVFCNFEKEQIGGWAQSWKRCSSIATDGKYFYATQLSGGELNFARIGTGYQGTNAGEYYGSCGRMLYGEDPNLQKYGTGSITYYPDGYVYVPTADPYRLLTIDTRVEILSGGMPDPWPTNQKTITGGLINRETGFVEPALAYGKNPLITSDGTYIYNISHRIDAAVSASELAGLPPLPGEQRIGYNGWKVVVLDPSKDWARVREFNVGTSSFKTCAALCDGRFLYLVEEAYSNSARVTRVDINTGEEMDTWALDQANTHVLAGQFDWINNKFWMGNYDGPVAYKYKADGIVMQPAPGELPGWKLIWNDEFQEDALDQEKWAIVPQLYPPFNQAPRATPAWKNGESQTYIPENVFVHDGMLTLLSRTGDMDGLPYLYTSGIVEMKRQLAFLYGRVEVKARMPDGAGMWPAIWMLPGDFIENRSYLYPPEVDIVEVKGQTPNLAVMTNHYRRYGTHYWDVGNYAGPDLSKDFHVYAIEWDPDEIRWYIDGVQRYTAETNKSGTTNQPDKPMYLIMNTAMGGNFVGAPPEASILPKCFDIEYVRIYQKSDAAPAAPAARQASP